jgi:cytochrome c551/c552
MRKIFLSLIPSALLMLIVWPGLNQITVASAKDHKDLFQTSDRCFACHNGLSTSSGEDISIGLSWRATMMANSARDPYWQAGVRRETIDHKESKAAIEDECAVCHMPMARYQSNFEGHEAEVFSHLMEGADEPMDRLARDGVSCSLCHQITKDKLGTRDSLVGRFVIDTDKTKEERAEYGPYKIEGGQLRIMRSSSGGYKPTEGEHIRQSELCATCHTLITKALGPGGQVIGQLPEQMPYQEWFASEFREKQSCQNCHMPVVEEETRIAVTLGLPREKMGRHVFVGGNFFIQRMLNKFRNELNVWALPEEFEAAANRTVEHLKANTVNLSIDQVNVTAGRLQADLSIENLSGHKFPTAYPSRRAWLHVTVRDRNNNVVFESGALNANGSIQGNDNDADATLFENHYTEITAADQVQIYEDIMVGRTMFQLPGF